MKAVEEYLSHVLSTHRTGAAVPETSYYGALQALLNELGKKLKPKVRCVLQLANRGAGLPDGGLYTQEQYQKAADTEPVKGQPPSRGAMEVKAPAEDIAAVAKSPQVARYVQGYGQVLVTNLRDFLLVVKGTHGQPVNLEGYTLAASADAFWRLCAQPRKSADQHGERLAEFLTRVMLHAAPLAEPKDVAWFLASYAREARARLELAALDPLPSIRAALEDALGIRFSGDKGEHFFRSTFVQTLFYGVFSAWVLWSKQTGGADPAARFRWKDTADYLHVPFLRALYYQLANPGPLKDLGLTEVLGWAEQVLNRVEREKFFAAFEQDQAVQYFYEPFLEAFDPALRKELGVWYTPHEVVQYMVARVDAVLREELDIADGLADEQVYVLDPCCGTGAFLVEVLKRIAATLREKGEDALLAQDLKRAALERVIGFEILTAPFVVSHLQLGLLLSNLGAPLRDDETERVGVYLTNALTGWEPPSGPKARLPFKEFEEERDAADAVKRERPILVVLGNPPYNAFAGVSPVEEQGLVDVYKEGLNKPVEQGGWGIKKFNLDDLYVRFFRLAERRIAENTGKGIICYISNFSYLADPSYVVMRQRFLQNFDKLWFDCLNGDSRETGKLTPGGKPDPSIFSTEYNKEGIRVGTTVSLVVRKKKRIRQPIVYFREFWGTSKRQQLTNCIGNNSTHSKFEVVTPTTQNKYCYRPLGVESHYYTWPRLIELTLSHFNGPVERRNFALISIDKQPLAHRMKLYFDSSAPDTEIASIYPSLMMTGNRIEGPKARMKILGAWSYNENKIVQYPFKPFDVRWCYLDNLRPLFSEPSPQLLSLAAITHNAFLISRDTADKAIEGPPFMFSQSVCDYDSISGHARHFPILIKNKLGIAPQKNQGKLLWEHEDEDSIIANISNQARSYLLSLGLENPDNDPSIAASIWMHALAMGYSRAYLEENADGIRSDWPRVPLPAAKEALLASAGLGHQLAALLDPESKVPGVTTGKLRPELKPLAAISREGGGQLDPGAGDLALTAGWGHAGQGGVTMPGKGRAVERPYTPDELAALEQGAGELGLTPEQALDLLGHTTLDVYLNDRAFWRNIPKNVWTYTIGGYQVIKKWLSYRERPLLGRDLTSDEARYVSEVARRIAAILLLGPALDANYQAVKADTYPWGQ